MSEERDRDSLRLGPELQRKGIGSTKDKRSVMHEL